MAELIHIYHFSFDEVVNMDVRWFCKLYNRIPVVVARRQLADVPLVSYPHMAKDSDRKRFQRSLEKAARLPKSSPVEHTSTVVGWERLRAFSGGGTAKE